MHMGKKKVRKLLFVSATALTVAVGAKAIDASAADSAGSVAVDEIDYENLTLTIKANPGDTRVLFATSKTAKTWDAVPGELSGENKITADISWVSVSKDTTLYFKGDKSTEPVAVTLPKQNKKFKAVFDPMTNTVSFKNQSNSSGSDGSAAQSKIYWRKSKSEQWTEYAESEMSNLLESFAMKGITLYFQEGQVAGTADNVGERPSKASSLKIAKRAAAPKVSLDYSKRTFNAKTTMEYRPVGETTWKSVESTTLSLKDALPKALDPTTITDPDATVSIDFRTKATAKKVSSQIRTVEVPVQEATPTDNVGFFYTGSQQCKVTIKQWTSDDKTKVLEAASSKNPYEYTVVQSDEKNENANLDDASSVSWTAITAEETTLSSSVAPDNSKIYIRKKATKSKLATKEVCAGSGKLSYPTASISQNPITIKRLQGTADKSLFNIPLGYKAGDIDSEHAKDIKITSITHDGKKIQFEADGAVVTEEGENGQYFISGSIIDTQALETDAYLDHDLLLKVVLSNGDIIGDVTEGENNSGGNTPFNIKLHIIRKAGIESGSENYVKYVNHNFDENGIQFTVKPHAGADIQSISYNGDPLDASQDYTLTSVADSDDIKVTINSTTINDFPTEMKTSEYGKTYPFVVTLKYKNDQNNQSADIKEEINAVGLKVDYPVKVSADATSIGILASSCTGSAIADPEITYTVSGDFCDATGFEVQSAKLEWNDTNVLGMYSYNASNRAVKVNVRLANLPEAFEKSKKESAPLILTLYSKDGKELVVDYGYYITLIQ